LGVYRIFSHDYLCRFTCSGRRQGVARIWSEKILKVLDSSTPTTKDGILASAARLLHAAATPLNSPKPTGGASLASCCPCNDPALGVVWDHHSSPCRNRGRTWIRILAMCRCAGLALAWQQLNWKTSAVVEAPEVWRCRVQVQQQHPAHSRHGAARTREGSDGRGTWKGMALHPPSHRSPCWGRSLGSLALNADSFGWQVTGALILFGDGAHVPDVRCQQPASCVGDGGGCNCREAGMGVPLKGSELLLPGCAYLASSLQKFCSFVRKRQCCVFLQS